MLSSFLSAPSRTAGSWVTPASRISSPTALIRVADASPAVTTATARPAQLARCSLPDDGSSGTSASSTSAAW